MSEWTQEEIEKLVLDVKRKAAMDEEFRKKLMEDARAAISELAGKEIPENVKIQIVEQDPNAHVTLVIPPFKGEELSEEDLESVAGGLCIVATDACGAKGCAAHASGEASWK